MEGLDSLKLAVDRFIAFASQHPEYKFLVTPIGCGIAGYRESQIGPDLNCSTVACSKM